MASYDHLIDNFDASPETKAAAKILKRQVLLKTGPGSGHELGSLTNGIPAVCMQISSERLNNTDVSKAGAQVASCLNKKDYNKVYAIIKKLLDDNEAIELSYHQLELKYRFRAFETHLKSYIAKVENELMTGFNMNPQTDAFKAAVFFWICSSAKVRTLTDTETFSHEHRLPLKKFVEALAHLNQSCSALQQEIKARFSAKSSPSKGSRSITPTRQSPRKASNLASTSATPEEEVEPVRRSLRNALAQDPILKTSPVKRMPQASPTKTPQPKSFRGFHQAKTQRELPNRDSPKKRAVESKPQEEEEDKEAGMEIDSTTIESPTKKRRVNTTAKLASRPSSPASRQQTRQTNVDATVFTSPSKTNYTSSTSVVTSFPTRNALKKASQAPNTDTESSFDESRPEVSLSIRRHRPVYLDHRQWNARDPRLDRIWRKAEKARKKSKVQVGMRPEDNDDVTMGE